MRFIRTSIHLSARAARRAKPQAGRASVPAFAASAAPSQRLLASLSRQAAAGLHTTASASAGLLDPLKTETDLAEGTLGLGVVTAEDTEESEESNRLHLSRIKPPIPAEQIDPTVQSIVEDVVDCSSGDNIWSTVSLASPSLKFKIVSRSMTACGRPLSNVELTNILTVKDLLTILHKNKPVSGNPYSNVDTVQEMFETRSQDFPANVYFLPPVTRGNKVRLSKERIQEKIDARGRGKVHQKNELKEFKARLKVYRSGA
ncbi:hypothetical protein DFS34DRAFT_639489 [Phlyctochytrium arcticum]|nr:hypothetical protein DFS34DRAFT_639489 [Phlyctochytrium arcticum]